MSLAMSAFAFNNCAYPDWEPESSAGAGDDDNFVLKTHMRTSCSVVGMEILYSVEVGNAMLCCGKEDREHPKMLSLDWQALRAIVS